MTIRRYFTACAFALLQSVFISSFHFSVCSVTHHHDMQTDYWIIVNAGIDQCFGFCSLSTMAYHNAAVYVHPAFRLTPLT
ncbi:hypothetical protein EDB19DRAFT_548214 [Suillus lakei]|nr:hypothetical protein EDB19DRAFT_548214 [Suillus lakei]